MANEIVEVLKTFEIDGATPHHWLQFQVDNTQPQVPLVSNLEPDYSIKLRNPFNLGQFAVGDMIEVLSVGINLPEQYQFAGENINRFFGFKYEMTETGTPANVEDLYAGGIWTENYELAVSSELQVNTGWATPGELSVVTSGGWIPSVSMLNVPDSENGKIYAIDAFVKIRHTVALS
jgi:hypothetical protein